MHYINIQSGLPLRDQGRNGKGHLHAMVYGFPDGVFVEQSEDHRQIIQRVLYPSGKLVVTCFVRADEEIRKLSEATVYLWGDKEGAQNDRLEAR